MSSEPPRLAGTGINNQNYKSLRSEITLPAQVPPHQFDALSSRGGVSLSRRRLEWLWKDSRWTDLLITVKRHGKLVGVLPCSFPRIPTWPDQEYNVGNLIAGQDCAPASACLLGGRCDARASMLFDPAVPDRQRRLVAACAVETGANFAESAFRRCAALYVSAEETELSAALRASRMTPHPAPPRCVIRWPAPTVDSYLDSLKASHRQVVRRDWRLRGALGLQTTMVGWHESVDDAAPMICDVLIKHGRESHPRLVSMRLNRLGRILGKDGFALRSSAGDKALGYAFGWYERDKVTMYEIGVRPGPAPLHRCSYYDLLVHAPVAAACARGITTLDLGLFAVTPKRLRGAVPELMQHWTSRLEKGDAHR